MRGLFSLFRRAQPAANRGRAKFDAAISPDEPFVAIGDIHGSAALLETLLQSIDQAYAGVRCICVGDYVDRGDRSDLVLKRLTQLSQDRGEGFVCLKGNHEAMLLSFLDAPEEASGVWLRNGGLQTLESFGVSYRHGSDPSRLRDALRDAMGDEAIAWLRNRPLHWQTGNVAVVHAAADPKRPIDQQSPKTLMWGHRDFLGQPRSDGVWVVHGHTIVDRPMAKGGRISIDTGAYGTGRLSAAHISVDGVNFFSNVDPPTGPVAHPADAGSVGSV